MTKTLLPITAEAMLPVFVAFLTFAAAGCAKQSVGDAQTQQASAGLQMSNADYVKNGEVGHRVYLSRTISEADLDWTLSLLAGAKNSLVRARALTILAQVHPLSAAQKAKIAPAVTPYLTSADELERSAAQKAGRWL